MIVIDPGHGGHDPSDRPYGAPYGIHEKQANLALAWRVAEHLGQDVALTRTGDVDVSLDDRTHLASAVQAHTFVSIHSDPSRSWGARAWVHPGADAPSRELAAAMGGTLGAEVGERAFGVLAPERLPYGTRAVLVEVGCPSTADPHELDAVAARIASAVQGSPTEEASWGRVAEGQSGIAYDPHSMGDSIAAFARWQRDLDRFLVGVPPSAHGYWPHAAICKLYAQDASGRGYRPPGAAPTGFLISPTRILTAGHVTRGRVRCIVAPGEANNSPANGVEVTGAANFVTHPRYRGGSAAYDIGVIKLPRPIRGVSPFRLGRIRQSVQEGVAVCGYGATVRGVDMGRWRMSTSVNPNVQHISTGASTADSTLEVLRYTCQTLPGTSGSPVLYHVDGELRAVGVHSGGYEERWNHGARLTDAKERWVRSI